MRDRPACGTTPTDSVRAPTSGSDADKLTVTAVPDSMVAAVSSAVGGRFAGGEAVEGVAVEGRRRRRQGLVRVLGRGVDHDGLADTGVTKNLAGDQRVEGAMESLRTTVTGSEPTTHGG